MPLLVDVDEVAVGDYSTEHGTVTKVNKTESSRYVELLFVNKTKLNLEKGTEIEMTQGGRFDRPVDATYKTNREKRGK